VGWPVIGALVTADDDLPGGWNKPYGRARPYWRKAGFWAQISLGIAVSSFIEAHETEYAGIHFGLVAVLFFIVFLLVGVTVPSRSAMNKKDVSDLIKSFLDGSCGKWDWDDFTSVRQNDFEIEQVREELISIHDEYPPDKLDGYCNEEGRKRLKEIAEILSVPETIEPFLLREGSDGKIEQAVLDFLQDHVVRHTRIVLDTRLIEDLGIDGDEGYYFLLEFIKRFDIDHSGFKYNDYFDSEWRLAVNLKPLRKMFGEQYHHSKKDLTVRELIMAAEQKMLPPGYPLG
jgi:hypothetical protein